MLFWKMILICSGHNHTGWEISDIFTVKLLHMVSGLNLFVNILSISVLFLLLILVDTDITGIKR